MDPSVAEHVSSVASANWCSLSAGCQIGPQRSGIVANSEIEPLLISPLFREIVPTAPVVAKRRN
jgi:hypothetical protein